MARLRPARTHRVLERPWTRVSRFQKKSFIRGIPGIKIPMFVMGNKIKKFDYTVELIVKRAIQIRHNALESARLSINRRLSKDLTVDGFRCVLNTYPHQVMREHAFSGVAGADRYQTGMAKAFGKPVGRSAQVKQGQRVFSVFVNEEGINSAKEALKTAVKKLPSKYSIEIKKCAFQ